MSTGKPQDTNVVSLMFNIQIVILRKLVTISDAFYCSHESNKLLKCVSIPAQFA